MSFFETYFYKDQLKIVFERPFFFVTDDTLIVFSNENRYKTFLQTDGFSDFEKQCTTVLAILQDVKWQLLA